ncbi:MAG: hypothetical protein NTY42_20580 [Planctomycetota bacterium]|nr:hypothetical protein [Planctomycetota bacterium]
MKKKLISAAFVAISCLPAVGEEPAKITFDDHVKPILREHCTSCHNANDKKSGLALDTYQAVMAGGSGGDAVVAGDLDSSRLYALAAHKEQPYMPPNQDMIPQAKVDLLKTWIEQGMPENSGSEIKKPKANAMAIAVKIGRPEGAPPMPMTMLKQTPFSTPRAATTAAIAASPWSPLIAVGGQMQVSFYHSETGQLMGILPFPEGEPQSITFSRDGKLVLVGGGKHSHSGFAALYDIATGNRIARVGDELDIVLSADINDNNQLIALAGPQKMVRVYETLTGQLKYEQKKHTDWIYSVAFSPDGLLLATSDRSGGLVVWEADTGRLYLDLQGHKGEVRSVAWRPDSQALVSASMDGTLKMWEMNEGKVLKSWDAHPRGAMAVAVCNDGTIVSTGKDNKVKVWDAGGNAAGEMPALVEAGHEVAITVDSKQVVAGDWAGNVRLWQRATPANETPLPANPVPLEAMLAKSQIELEQATVAMQSLQKEFTEKSSQLGTIQKQVVDLQTQLSAAVAQVQSLTEKQNQIKPNYDSLTAQWKAKSEEMVPVQSSRQSKLQMLVVAKNNKSKFDSEIAELQKQSTAAGADATAIGTKVAETQLQSSIQTAALTQIAEDLAPIEADFLAREKQLAELKPMADAITSEWNTVAKQLAEQTALKGTLEPKVEPLNVALKSATDAAAATKTKLDTATTQLQQHQASLAQIQSDIAMFANRLTELAQKRTAAEQALAGVAAQIEPSQSNVNAAKTQVDTIAAEVAKVEQQLAALQKRLAEEQAKKTTASNDMKTKQQELDALREKSQQLETELANHTMQTQLFEQSYGKK